MGEYIQNSLSNKRLYPKYIHNYLYVCVYVYTHNPIKKWGGHLNKHFPKQDLQDG